MVATLMVFQAEYQLRHSDWLKLLGEWQPETSINETQEEGWITRNSLQGSSKTSQHKDAILIGKPGCRKVSLYGGLGRSGWRACITRKVQTVKLTFWPPNPDRQLSGPCPSGLHHKAALEGCQDTMLHSGATDTHFAGIRLSRHLEGKRTPCTARQT